MDARVLMVPEYRIVAFCRNTAFPVRAQSGPPKTSSIDLAQLIQEIA